MKKLRLIGLTEATWLFINNARAIQACLPRGRDLQSSLLREMCQQLATDLLTGDLSPTFHPWEALRLLKKGYTGACNAGHSADGVGEDRGADGIPQDPSLTAKTGPLRVLSGCISLLTLPHAPPRFAELKILCHVCGRKGDK